MVGVVGRTEDRYEGAGSGIKHMEGGGAGQDKKEEVGEDEHTETSKFVDDDLDKSTSKEHTCDFKYEDGFDIIFTRDEAVTKNSYNLKRLSLESDDQNSSKVVRNALIKLAETESSETLISMFELIDEFIHEYGLLQDKDGTNDDFICKFCFVTFNANMRSRGKFCCDASKQLDKVRKAWKLHDTTNIMAKLDENIFIGMLDSIMKKADGNLSSETYLRESDKIDDKDGLAEENKKIKEQHEILESRRLPQNFINYQTKTKKVSELDEYANENSDSTRKKRYKELYDKNNEETNDKQLKQKISLLGRDPASVQRDPESERIFSQKSPRNASEINDGTQRFVKYTSITPRNVSQHSSENRDDSSTKYSDIALAKQTFSPNFIMEKAQGSKQTNYSVKKEIGKNEKPKTGRTYLQAIQEDDKATINSQQTNKKTNFESNKKTGLLSIGKKIKQYKDYERGTKTKLSEWTPFSEITSKRGTESKRASSKYSSSLQFDKSSNKAFKQQFNAVSEVIMVSQATVSDGFFKGLTQSDNFRVDSEELPPEETSFFPNIVNETFLTKRSKNYPTDKIMKPLNTEFMSQLMSIDTDKTAKKRDIKDGVSTKLHGDVKIYNTMKKGQQQSERAAELSDNMDNISLHKTKNLTNMETEIYKSSLQSIKKLGQASSIATRPIKKDAMDYGEDKSDSNLIMFAESEERSGAKNKHAIGDKGNVKTSSPNLAFSIPMTSLTSVARKTQSARNRQKIHESSTSHVLDPTIWEQREDVSLIMQRYDSSGERKPEFCHGSNVHHGDRTSQKVVKGGIISYRLSDPKYLELGWSILPSEKLMRKVVTFQTEPSKPRSVWRTNRAESETKWYSENKLFSTFDLEGSGKVFYPDGSVAVSLNRTTSGSGRLTVLGHRDPLEKNEKISNVPMLAIFDSSGNGIVCNTFGDIRVSYTQKEGILLETPNGSPMKWKWPALQGFEDKFEEVLCKHESQDDPHLKDPQSLCESKTYKQAILKAKEQRENVANNMHASQTGPSASIHTKKRLHHSDELNYCSRGSKTSHHKVREGSTDRSLKMRLSPSMTNDDMFRTHTREDISKISHEDKEVVNTPETKKNQANGTYTPIKPIMLKINEFITFKLMDQANICIDFSADKHFQRLDMGVIVNPSLTNHVDYVDPDLWEKEKIPSPFRRLLGLSPSHNRNKEGKSGLKNKSQKNKLAIPAEELSSSHLNKTVVSVENRSFDLNKSRNSGDLIPPHRTKTLMIEDLKLSNPAKTHIPVIRT
ncbi:unnamed protein product [Timema podura]|uniref:FAM194 C-terminal domain-containing protein n=1 Tax=Timema podura TaxID=61482 RepID=A0ABN7NHD1_TIMPD|nr:unnamed protein product [Timema podura]